MCVEAHEPPNGGANKKTKAAKPPPPSTLIRLSDLDPGLPSSPRNPRCTVARAEASTSATVFYQRILER